MNNFKSSPGTGNQMFFSDMKNGAQKCYNFNYEGTCFRQHCFYTHSCIRCNGGHSMLQCHSKQGQAKFQNSGSDFRPENRGFGRLRFPRNTQQFLNQNFHLGTLEQIRDKDLLLRLWDKGYTPINSRSLQEILVSYPDQEVAAELLDGFSNGFRLKYTGPRIHTFFFKKSIVCRTTQK